MPATSSTAPLASGTTTSASIRGATAATPGTRLASGNTVSSSSAPRPVISRPARPAMASTVRANAPSVLILVTRTAMNTATPRAMPTRGNNARRRCCDRSGRLTKRHNVSTPRSFSCSPPSSLCFYLCQRRLGLGQPGGHLHGTVEIDRAGQRSTRLLALAGPGVEGTQAEMAVGLERAHPQFLGQSEGLAVMGCGLGDVRGRAMRGDVAEQAQGLGLVAAFLVFTCKCQRALGKGVRLLQAAGPQ